MTCPGPSEICPAPFLSLFLNTQENSRKEKRKKNEEKKRALIKTRIYNYCISYALPDYRDSGRSRPMETKRTGGGECRAGTGSPRKTFALARWMQHEIIPYQRHISADGSTPRAEARARASFRVKVGSRTQPSVTPLKVTPHKVTPPWDNHQ